MGTTFSHTFGARCPLCESPVLSVASSGEVIAFGLRAVPLAGEYGRGYTLCDDCGLLADRSIGRSFN